MSTALPMPLPMQRGSALLLALALTLAGLMPMIAPAAVRAAPTDLFISEYIEGSSNNKALEIFNGTGASVDLTAGGYSVQVFFNGSATAGLTINLTGTVATADVFVLAQSSANATILAQADQTNGSGWFNGDDAVVLRRGTTVLDVIGQIGIDPGTEWGTGLTSTADNTLRRKDTIQAGDTNGADAFDPAVEWDGFATDTFAGLGSHALAGGEQPIVVTCGAAMNVLSGSAATRAVTATDADGTVTQIAVTAISDDPGTITVGATTPAAGVGGTASADLAVADDTPPGSYTVTLTATNAESETGTCDLAVNVQEVLRVSDVQGQTADAEQGRSDGSPIEDETVFVRGVVTERIRTVSNSGSPNYAFFFQDHLDDADGDPLTSDGIVVFIGGFTTLLNAESGGPTYSPQVGDQIVIRARVDEFFNLTELVSPRFVAEEVDRGVLSDMVEIGEAAPPDLLADAYRYWERREGMLLTVPAGSVVTGARDVFASTADGEAWVVRGDHPLAQRTDPYARRVFRDPHPLDDVSPAGSFDNANGMRILLLSHGLKWNAASNATLIAPVRTFDTVTNALTGGVYYSFGKYGLEIGSQLETAAGPDPALNAPPVPHDTDVEHATAPYNVENLYDFRDDPFDGCDFPGNDGCPGVDPPFDYVPASEADYHAHLDALADQVVNDLHAPDILLIQEAEDQDICTVDGGALACGATDDADGRPDTLQELALAILLLGGPSYDAAYDRDGADDRGIVSAFLYRTDRVELLEADADDPVLGSATSVEYPGAGLDYNADVSNPKALNAELPEGVAVGDECDVPGVDCVFTRDPQVALFRVWRDGIGTSVFTDLYAISNHFSSGPDSRVAQRTEQATYNAAIVEALAGTEAGARVVVGGDFNVFPEPDDPFAPPNESNQLVALYDLGLHSLWEVVADETPSSAYSYVFEGQAQTLDNQFTTDTLRAELTGVRFAHVNADWPAAHDGDGSRGASDHDPQVARYDAARVDALVNLVEYLIEAGAIDPPKASHLLDRLARVARLASAGNTADAQDQLEAFGNQAQGLSPRWVDPDAADILELEAEVLAGDL